MTSFRPSALRALGRVEHDEKGGAWAASSTASGHPGRAAVLRRSVRMEERIFRPPGPVALSSTTSLARLWVCVLCVCAAACVTYI